MLSRQQEIWGTHLNGSAHLVFADHGVEYCGGDHARSSVAALLRDRHDRVDRIVGLFREHGGHVGGVSVPLLKVGEHRFGHLRPFLQRASRTEGGGERVASMRGD